MGHVQFSVARVSGLLFIAAWLAFVASTTLLQAEFGWPDILREPPTTIIASYSEHGSRLTWIWLATAWSYGLLLLPTLLLHRVLTERGRTADFSHAAAVIGAIGVVASAAGFLRWVFVVPPLVEAYADPEGFATTREAVIAAFLAQHQFGGALLGEHLGQLLASAWSAMVAIELLRDPRFPHWLGWTGLVAAACYLVAQGEVLATGIEGFPVSDIGGLIGTYAWALWVLALGLTLTLRSPTSAKARASFEAP